MSHCLKRKYHLTISNVILLSLAFPNAILAQTTPVAPQLQAPLMEAVDETGINLKSGRISLDLPKISIEAAPNLNFNTIRDFLTFISSNTVLQYNTTVELSAFTVHKGSGIIGTFSCNDHDCVDDQWSQSNFDYYNNISGKKTTATYYDAETGGRYVFDVQSTFSLRPASGIASGALQSVVYASEINYPDGEVIKFKYLPTDLGAGMILQRPDTVTSNVGYGLKFSYQSDDSSTLGWARLKSVYAYSLANPDNRLAELEYAYDAGGVAITEKGRGSLSRTYKFSQCGCELTGSNEVYVATVTRPDDNQPSIKISKHAQLNLVSQITKDNREWNFEYTNPVAALGSPGQYKYSKLTVKGPDQKSDVYEFNNIIIGSDVIKSKQITSHLDKSGNLTTFTYFSDTQRVKTIVFPEGNSDEISYDSKGNVSQIKHHPKPNSGLSDLKEDFYYNPTCGGGVNRVDCHRPVYTRDTKQNQTDYSYNSRGQLLSKISPPNVEGLRTKIIVDYATNGAGISKMIRMHVCQIKASDGSNVSCGTVNEKVSEFEYLENTDLQTLQRDIDYSTGLIRETKYTYDSLGKILSRNGPRPGDDDATFNRYDGFGRSEWSIGEADLQGRRQASRLQYRNQDDQVAAKTEGTLTQIDGSDFVVRAILRNSYDSSTRDLKMTEVIVP